jgi:hypothetical protein
MVGGAGGHASPFGECDWPGRFLPAEGLQLTNYRHYFGYGPLLGVTCIARVRPRLLSLWIP